MALGCAAVFALVNNGKLSCAVSDFVPVTEPLGRT